MKKLIMLILVLMMSVVSSVSSQAGTITIGSFDDTRAVSAFATEGFDLGYSHIRAALLNPANFGPRGIVSCDVVIAAGTPAITAAYLADKQVFFTSVFGGDLSADEATAIGDFVARGGCVIVESNSSGYEQTAATSLLAAIGTTAALTSALGCPNSPTGGTFAGAANEITNGPFGNIAGGSFATSISSIITQDGRDTLLVTCDGGANKIRAYFPEGAISAGSGLVLYGGDPSAFDLFTDPAGGLFNANNEVMYLNAIATVCEETTAITLASFDAAPGNGSVTLAWTTGDETNNFGFNVYRADSSEGTYVKLNTSVIASQSDSGEGASYVYADDTAQNRKTYYYKLEDVDVNGVSTFNGPISATPRLLFGIF